MVEMSTAQRQPATQSSKMALSLKLRIYCLLSVLAACALLLLLGVMVDNRLLFVVLGIFLALVLIGCAGYYWLRFQHSSFGHDPILVRQYTTTSLQKLQGKLTKLHADFTSLLPRLADDPALLRRVQTTAVEIHEKLQHVNTWLSQGPEFDGKEEEKEAWDKVASWESEFQSLRARCDNSSPPRGVNNEDPQLKKACSAVILVPPPYEKEPPLYIDVASQTNTSQSTAVLAEVSVTAPMGPPPLYTISTDQ